MTASSFTERRLAVDGREMRVLEAGQGDPIVYLHGGGGLHANGALELLAASFRLVALEIPGFGGSAAPRTVSMDELAGTMAAAVAAAGVPEGYTLLGTSLGGAIALHLALRHPDRVSGLVLESPAAFRPSGWSPPDPADIQRALFAHPQRATPRRAPRPELAEREQALLARLLDAVDEPALSERLGRLGVPTLVLFGTEDGLLPPEMGRTYREVMPNCSFVLVYDAAHEVGSDRPEAVADLVADFARRREAFVVGEGSAVINP